MNWIRKAGLGLARAYVARKRREQKPYPAEPWRRSETLPWNKLFQIGFSKCGTSSLARYLENNGLATLDWGVKKEWLRVFYTEGCLTDWPRDMEGYSRKTWNNLQMIERRHCVKQVKSWGLDESLEARCLGYVDLSVKDAYVLARRMRVCELAGKPLLDLVPKQYDVVSDMRATAFGVYKDPNAKDGVGYIREYLEFYKKFDVFDAQYPDSRFILNLRDPHKWVNSELNWMVGAHVPSWHKLAYAQGVAPEELRDVLLADWDAHLAAVRKYFADRPGQLLEFDIEQDTPEKINEFLDLDLDTKHWAAKNVSQQKVVP